MKTLLKTLLLTVPVAGSAFAEPALLKTSFWQVPYEREIVVKVAPRDSNLGRICAEFRELVEADNGRTPLDAREFENLRRLSDSMDDKSFYATFAIDGEATERGILEALSRVNAAGFGRGGIEPLPWYFQKSTRLVPAVQPQSEPEIVGSRNSLIQIARSLGLKAKQVTFIGDGYSAQIKVYGKDVACDLLAGDARIEFESTGKVQIDFEDQKRIDGFYHGLEELTEAVFKNHIFARRRAASFGYRLHDVLKAQGFDRESGERFTGNLMDLLFEKGMKYSSAWTAFQGRQHLSVSGAVSGAIHVRMEK